ncbi:hypothetical protein K461DRAFT_55883 [Myriangium duriaei CBS 260.36]|uniref:Uncharacterized protein n=1 Tax=Myriangium duriaei CBS 260.36 TaxID=1168546 RepID=A0A9P4IS21_9PEZI|nr:hypothetical protein K461DRAFT_55883 [Myriangium duriaei CBS 260.36]
MAPALALLYLALPRLVLTISGERTCYSSEGTNLTDINSMRPCNIGAAETHCCVDEDICLSNGYCLGQTKHWRSRTYRSGSLIHQYASRGGKFGKAQRRWMLTLEYDHESYILSSSVQSSCDCGPYETYL